MTTPKAVAARLAELLCECGKVRGHVTPHAPGTAPAAFRIRTRCYTTYDSEGYAHDEWVDEILPPGDGA